MKKVFLLLLLGLLGNILSHAQSLYGLDPAFANNGIYTGDTGTCAKIAVQQDGKIVVLGGERKNGQRTTAMRFNNNGSIDNSFADNGYFRSPVVESESGYSWGLATLCLQPDGKILLAGSADTGATKSDFLLMRLKQDGTLDSSFGGGGYVMTAYIPPPPSGFGNREHIVSVAIRPDGKILAYGYCDFVTDTLHIIQYHSDGKIDSSFGVNGRVRLTEGFRYPKPNGIALLPDGKIVVGAKATVSALNPPWGNDAFTAIRLHPEGSLDTSFNHTGIAYTNINLGGLLYCTAILLQQDGKILLGGHADSIAVVRFDTTGELDNGFGVNGLVKLDPAGKTKGMLIQPDGKIVLATNPDGFPYPDTGYTIYRIMPDGKTDHGFGANGKVLTKLTNESTIMGGIALQVDGKLVVGGGFLNGNSTTKLLLARYTPNATAVQQLNRTAPITIYPNPVTDYMYVDNPTTQTIQLITVYAPDGKLLLVQSRPFMSKLSTEGLADGIYFLHIRFANLTTLVKKIIIQH